MVALASLLWGIFEISHIYNKREDSDDVDLTEQSFCSYLESTWSDVGGLRAQDMFVEGQLSSLLCKAGVWGPYVGAIGQFFEF